MKLLIQRQRAGSKNVPPNPQSVEEFVIPEEYKKRLKRSGSSTALPPKVGDCDLHNVEEPGAPGGIQAVHPHITAKVLLFPPLQEFSA